MQLVVLPVFVAFQDHDQGSAGFEHAQDLLHIPDGIGPIILGFHGRHQVKFIVGKRQPRHRSLFDLNAARRDQPRIPRARRGYAALGVIHTVNRAFGGQRRQFFDGPAATATHIQNSEGSADANVRQTPIGQARVGPVHEPQEEPADPPAGLADLIHQVRRGRQYQD